MQTSLPHRAISIFWGQGPVGNFKDHWFLWESSEEILCKGFSRSARFKLVHKFDDSAPGILSNQKKTTTLEISLISLLHSMKRLVRVTSPSNLVPGSDHS